MPRLWNRTPELLFKQSVHGNKLETFHQMCDNQCRTLFLATLEDDSIVGAFVSIPIRSGGNTWFDGSDAFIFTYKNSEIRFFDRKQNPWDDGHVGMGKSMCIAVGRGIDYQIDLSKMLLLSTSSAYDPLPIFATNPLKDVEVYCFKW